MVDVGPEKARIFRVTHTDNVPWILEHGLRCQNSTKKDPDFVPIGMADLIEKRRLRSVEIGPGGTLADYVPFYFTPFSIMMYNIKTGYNGVTKRANSEIAVLVSSLDRLRKLNVPFLFTDGHAYPIETNYYDDTKHLDEIDWTILQNRDFKNNPEDPGKQTRYQAEALVHRRLSVEALLGIACYDTTTSATLQEFATIAAVQIKIEVLPKWYF